MNARLHPSIPLAGLALALAIPLSGCGRGSGAHDADAAAAADTSALLAAADVARAVRADLVAGVPVSGTLAPAIVVNVTAPVGEVIEQVPIREGQVVHKGQTLASFRDASLRPAAASAEAAQRVAAADLERMRNLFAEGAVSKRDLEGAEAQARAAEAQWAAASSALDDAVVRAPFDGVISVRHVESGDRVGIGDPLFQLVNTDELEFEATVPSAFVPTIATGMPVRLEVSGLPSGAVRGRVARINAAADPATRQVKLYVRVANQRHTLVGGLFASGSIVIREALRALAVPIAAVRGDGADAWVMIVERGVLERRPVALGVRDETRGLAEVRSGLAEGDRVVTGPIQGLAPGRGARVEGEER
jgi:RND family efflux transporter MFP subunit